MKGEEREVKPETMDGWSRAVPLKKKKKIHKCARTRHRHTFSNPVSEEEGVRKGVGFSLPTRPIQRRFL